nr:GAF and ANTAR domain-containing protein [Kineococcus siccus]
MEEVLARLTQLVAGSVRGADGVSLTVTGGGGARTAASTGGLAVALDEQQYASGRGPCLDAARGATVVRVADTARDADYPDFAAAAREHGVRSSLSVGLPARSRVPGALNLYRVDAPVQVDAEGEQLASLFATFAAVALVNAAGSGAQAARTRYLHVAVRNRALIDQATGIVMAQEGCDADRAYDRLVERSRSADRPVLEVAADLVAAVDRTTGERPD